MTSPTIKRYLVRAEVHVNTIDPIQAVHAATKCLREPGLNVTVFYDKRCVLESYRTPKFAVGDEVRLLATRGGIAADLNGWLFTVEQVIDRVMDDEEDEIRRTYLLRCDRVTVEAYEDELT